MKPMQGVKVLELGTLIAGPFCTRILGEFGADVVKVDCTTRSCCSPSR